MHRRGGIRMQNSDWFSQIGECGAVELDFRRASFLPDESGTEECDYIRPARFAGSSVCARMVTGSLLFGSPHRLCMELSLLGGGLTILIYPERVWIFSRVIILAK